MAQRFATEALIDTWKKNTVFMIIKIQNQYKLKISPRPTNLDCSACTPGQFFLAAK